MAVTVVHIDTSGEPSELEKVMQGEVFREGVVIDEVRNRKKISRPPQSLLCSSPLSGSLISSRGGVTAWCRMIQFNCLCPANLTPVTNMAPNVPPQHPTRSMATPPAHCAQIPHHPGDCRCFPWFDCAGRLACTMAASNGDHTPPAL